MNYGYITVASAIPSVRVADADYNIKKIESLIAQAEGKGAEILFSPNSQLQVTPVKISLPSRHFSTRQR